MSLVYDPGISDADHETLEFQFSNDHFIVMTQLYQDDDEMYQSLRLLLNQWLLKCKMSSTLDGLSIEERDLVHFVNLFWKTETSCYFECVGVTFTEVHE